MPPDENLNRVAKQVNRPANMLLEVRKIFRNQRSPCLVSLYVAASIDFLRNSVCIAAIGAEEHTFSCSRDRVTPNIQCVRFAEGGRNTIIFHIGRRKSGRNRSSQKLRKSLAIHLLDYRLKAARKCQRSRRTQTDWTSSGLLTFCVTSISTYPIPSFT
jgi:hypothetical protein